MKSNILLADDHGIVRDGIKSYLESEGFHVIAEASTGDEAVRLAVKCAPDVAILDLSMPHLNGIDAARELLRECPKINTILMTVHNEVQYILEALRAGIRGYVLKSHAAGDLVQAIHEVSRGSTYLSPGISQVVVEAYLRKHDLPADPLTVREHRVLQLVAEGKSTKEIASLLGISHKTAETHRTNIMDKLDIHGTAGLVRYAIRRGLIQP